ncbi:hypothetical protein FRC98_11330 [Lujinxingia vulgaris]|uniref:DNA-binding beta-propeller fold protein YncE n=1 Tax=Lujinxingia vulgaris TaxID=2600176 RepID=A0A5C6X7P7_9DELT|nr:hypothetical protein [Lujinxingia vulgaris]TXD37314.1 hypothetical protein FRC98_11330 [Lujinxingia vulgaris]
MTHLKLITRHPLRDARQRASYSGQILVEGDRLFVIDGNQVQILDISAPLAPRDLGFVAFRESVTGIALHNELLYAAEWMRALNLVDLRDPIAPDYFDARPFIGERTGHVVRLGDYLVMGLNRKKGFALFDLKNPRAPRLLQRLPMEQDIEHVILDGELVLIANYADGLRWYDIAPSDDDHPTLHEVRHLETPDFKADRVYPGKDRLYVVGRGKGCDIIVLDRHTGERLGEVQVGGMVSSNVVEVGDQALFFASDHTCYRVDPDHQIDPLFSQYFADDDRRYVERTNIDDPYDHQMSRADDMHHWVLRGDKLIAIQGEALVVYQVEAGSAFAAPIPR